MARCRSACLAAVLIFLNPSFLMECASTSLRAGDFEGIPKLDDFHEDEKEEKDYVAVNPDDHSVLSRSNALLLASSRLPLDKITGGVVLRELDERNEDAVLNPIRSILDTVVESDDSMKDDGTQNFFGSYPDFGMVNKRNFDEIDRAGFKSLGKRNFDEIDRAGFRVLGKRNFDEIDRAGFLGIGKRNFDEIDRAGFRGIGKRNFDEIDRAGFRAIGKRNFDEIDRAGFRAIGKRNFDEIDRAGFRGIGKKNFDEIDRAGFSGIGKRNFDEIDRAGFRGIGKRNFDEIDRSGFRAFGKRNFDEIDRAGFRGVGKRGNPDENEFPLLADTESQRLRNPKQYGDSTECQKSKDANFKEASIPRYPLLGKPKFDETYKSGKSKLKPKMDNIPDPDVAA